MRQAKLKDEHIPRLPGRLDAHALQQEISETNSNGITTRMMRSVGPTRDNDSSEFLRHRSLPRLAMYILT